jgi:hypothetical protein
MPTNRQRRTRAPELEVSANVRHFLETGEGAPGDLEVFMLQGSLDRLREAWGKVKAELMAAWVKRTPCTRPWCWWACDSPRHDTGIGAWFEPLPAPRRRLGGIGTPDYEVLAFVPRFSFGIPAGWVEKWAVDYYNGRAKDIHGKPIGTEFKEGDFAGVAIDPSDPPRYESVAAYLDRHQLLTPAEVKYLAAHPELLAPETVVFDEDEITAESPTVPNE